MIGSGMKQARNVSAEKAAVEVQNLKSGTKIGCCSSGFKETWKRVSGVDAVTDVDGGESLENPKREGPVDKTIGQLVAVVSEKPAPRTRRL